MLMKTVADPDVRTQVVARLRRLTPETARRWGTMTPHEMLCHLGDASEMVLRVRPRTKPIQPVARPIFKTVALWTPLRAPRGVKTNPEHDPKAAGTRPSDFEADRRRVTAALEAIAAADPAALETAHGMLGVMSLRDWQRWAYKHTDHHLRQFGL